MEYYAHSHPDYPNDPSKWQKLQDHLRNVAEKAAAFARPFESQDWAWNAGWLHDLGKADSAFQGYLRRENELDDAGYDAGNVNHSSAGAAFGEEQHGKLAGRILSYVTAGHHAGLPDWYASETGNAALSVRLAEGEANLARIREYANAGMQELRSLTTPPVFVRKPADFHMWVRMLYSCLADADFLDTESFMQPGKVVQRAGFAAITELKSRFDKFITAKETECERSRVNEIRREVLVACRDAAKRSPGLYSLTVPTGGGKTLSGMAFALDHAVKHGMKRIVYVIPYTSIIEQTAGVFGAVFGGVNVVEHHSNLNPDKETPRSALAAENWDAPIVVTTNVQFFESLYGARPGACRKLHNLVNSVIILDEAQMIPPELLTPCVDVMNQLVRNYGATLVLATATQPALPGLDVAAPIIAPDMDLYGRLKRVDYALPAKPQKTGWPELAQRLQEHRQVLCVVNTRKDCRNLFALMPSGSIHLSALMCGAHRSNVIAGIKDRLRQGEEVRVISTQLVEAGVDIDFPVVYRALAGLDSIAQAAGRCNREGRLVKGSVSVFVPEEQAPPGLLRKGEQTTREMCAGGGVDMHDPEVFRRYFDLFYAGLNDTGGRFREWLERDAIPTLAFQFRTAAMDFNLIKDQGRKTVFVRYAESPKWLDQMRVAGPVRESLRRLQRFTVNLSLWDFNKAVADGLVEEVWKDYWCWVGDYDDVLGLNMQGSGRTPGDLIV